LKTEEKTKRQCGQHGGRFADSLELSVNFKSTGPNRWQISRTVVRPVEHSLDRTTALHTNEVRVRSDEFSLESLILAQDERWRRA
jgi:hypothetical protein